MNKIADLGIKFNYRYFTNMVHIYTYTRVEHDKALENISSFAPCFSRGIQLIKPLRVLCKGFPNTSLDTLKPKIHEWGLRPHSARLVRASGGSATIALDFVKGTMTMERLKTEFVGFCRNLVHWSLSMRSNTNPPICYRCSMWGHVSINCRRTPVCYLCAENHTAENCPLAILAPEQRNHCCVNCLGAGKPHAHHAQEDVCPAKRAYMADRHKKNKASLASKRQPPNMISNEFFPPLPHKNTGKNDLN